EARALGWDESPAPASGAIQAAPERVEVRPEPRLRSRDPSVAPMPLPVVWLRTRGRRWRQGDAPQQRVLGLQSQAPPTAGPRVPQVGSVERVRTVRASPRRD